MSLLLLLITLYPAALLLCMAWRPVSRYSPWWIVTAPLPALLIGLFAPELTLQVPFLLFGMVWELNDFSRPLLVMSALLWSLAGLYGRDYLRGDPALRRYTLFWLLTLIGNLALIMAQDIASFYTGFALMTFAGYGLVVHTLSPKALLAGKVYIVMAVLGEMLILAGFVMVLPDIVSPMLHYVPLAIVGHDQGILIAALLFAGFGVKAGVIGLHFWLPLAHPVAPTPASAVLSGAMIKAGLIAWIQVLPLDAEQASLIDMQTFGYMVVTLGLVATFLAGILGSWQAQAKAVLAYSSISQMGLMTCLLGVGMIVPLLWPAVLLALLAFMVHHGLAKGALFLSVGLADHPGKLSRNTLLLMAAIPAVTLVGLPLTSGSAAKYALKEAVYQTDLNTLGFLLTLAAAATSLLMIRFLHLLYQSFQPGRSWPTITAATLLAILASSVLIWFLPVQLNFIAPLSLATLWDSMWPLLLAVALYAAWQKIVVKRYFAQ